MVCACPSLHAPHISLSSIKMLLHQDVFVLRFTTSSHPGADAQQANQHCMLGGRLPPAALHCRTAWCHQQHFLPPAIKPPVPRTLVRVASHREAMWPTPWTSGSQYSICTLVCATVSSRHPGEGSSWSRSLCMPLSWFDDLVTTLH